MGRCGARAAAGAGQTDRLSVNALSFLATCVLLAVAVGVSDGGFANSIDKITKNLDVALRDLMDDMPKYTNYTESEDAYASNAALNPKGMAGLYNLTNKFMDLVLQKDFLMDGLLVAGNGGVRLGDVKVADVLKYYWAVVLMLAVLALMAIFIPLCGLFFCCCRCCGNCGARSLPCDKKRDLCKKIVQGTLLIILSTGLLFCVVCAFASNQQLEDGIDALPEHFKDSQKDTSTYLNSVQNQASHLLVTNYQEFSTVFTSTMNKSSEYVMQQLEIWSNATAMMTLYTFVDTLPVINSSLFTLKTDTNTLRASASQLNDAMRKVKKELLNTLYKCETDKCKDIKNNISQLQTNIDFNRLPDVSPTISKLKELDIASLQSATLEGKKKLDDIQGQIESKLKDTLTKAVNTVNEAGDTLKSNMTSISDFISNIQTQVNKLLDDVIPTVDRSIKQYGQYRYYGGLAISCTLLLITVCLALGLICGICGKRPDGYSDNCCNKGAGSQFLICAVMLMFLFGVVIAVVTIAMFAVGMAGDRVICYPMRNPLDSSVGHLIDEHMRLAGESVVPTEALSMCYRNESLYNILNYYFKDLDIDSLHQRFDILSFLDDMNTQLEGIITKNFTILSYDNEKILENLRSLDPINFDQFQDELKQNFTNLSLSEISKELENLVNTIGDNHVLSDVKSDVQLSILHINTYDEKLLIPMKELALKVIDNAKELDTTLKMNSSSFAEAIDKLLTEIKDAQLKLQHNGTVILQTVGSQFGEMVQGQVNSYLYRVGNITKYELGQCGPMSVMINSTVVAACDKVLLPLNGLWVSLFLSLILFVPTIIVSVKLASLYQKYKQYGQYVETEYLYDAYADRGDNIPLNSRGKRGKKKTKKSKQYEERPQNVGGEVIAREYAATSHHPPDTRYADMAPKHWEEFPNGGPPQYQRAPTEYERPPPYYYPGTGDQQ